MKRIVTATRLLVVPAVVAMALLPACGGGDSGEATSPVAPERVDAPARAQLEARAERYERSAHLQGQARTYGVPAERQDGISPNPDEAENRAVAEWFERSSKFEGQARTYGNANSTDDASAPADEASDENFVPGSRHMPMR